MNQSNPKFSIIVVVYNAASTIQRCIDTVLQQDYDNKELVIIDGGSTDGTVEILKANRFVDCWLSEPDSGIYNAMNKGAGICSCPKIERSVSISPLLAEIIRSGAVLLRLGVALREWLGGLATRSLQFTAS